MDYEKALKAGKLDERMAYAWLKSDPKAQSKLAKYAREQGKDSIYDLFPGKRGETVVSAPENDSFYDAQAFLSQTGLPIDHPGQRPNQISPGSRMSLADLENQYGSLDLEQPNDMPEKALVPAESLKSESIRPDYSDPKKSEEQKTLTEPAAPAPAPEQAQAARPTLDQPDNGKSAFARAAARTMPDFVNRLGGNGRFANQAKLQMMQEAKRRQQNELATLQKSEKAAKRAGEVDEILNAKNDQYRQLYANSSKDRSVEDWDAMDRDQKIKMIQNYNINQSLGPAKTLENPDAPKTAQAKPAAVRPDGSPVSQAYFDQFFNNPDVPDFGNIADQPPTGMAPVYGPEGKIGYKSRSETAEAAKNYAKKSMRNNPMSTTGNVFSGDMERLYPSLPVNRFKEEVDFDETEKQKKYNPFS
jgi:hypothetical protein